MTSLLPILSNIESKGSGSGISHYSQRCARRVRLDRETGTRESSFQAQRGTVFHKLEELYYTNQLSNTILPLEFDKEQCKTDPVLDALRGFVQYIKIFPKDEFTTIGCEYLLPQNSDQTQAVEEIVGISPFTCRIDHVVKVESPDHAAKLKELRGLDLEPGIYLKDTKTSDKKDRDAQFKYDLSVQFPAYIMAWNAAFPATPAKGMIVNNVVFHDDLTKREDGGWRSFRSFLVRAPDAHEQDVVRKYLQYKKTYLESDHCELTACIDYGVCPHYLNGRCLRI